MIVFNQYQSLLGASYKDSINRGVDEQVIATSRCSNMCPVWVIQTGSTDSLRFIPQVNNDQGLVVEWTLVEFIIIVPFHRSWLDTL